MYVAAQRSQNINKVQCSTKFKTNALLVETRSLINKGYVRVHVYMCSLCLFKTSKCVHE